MRRQQWLAKLQAAEVARVLLGESKSGRKPYKETSLDGLMGQMGAKWQ